MTSPSSHWLDSTHSLQEISQLAAMLAIERISLVISVCQQAGTEILHSTLIKK